MLFLSTYCVPGTIVGVWDPAVDKTQNPLRWVAYGPAKSWHQAWWDTQKPGNLLGHPQSILWGSCVLETGWLSWPCPHLAISTSEFNKTPFLSPLSKWGCSVIVKLTAGAGKESGPGHGPQIASLSGIRGLGERCVCYFLNLGFSVRICGLNPYFWQLLCYRLANQVAMSVSYHMGQIWC